MICITRNYLHPTVTSAHARDASIPVSAVKPMPSHTRTNHHLNSGSSGSSGSSGFPNFLRFISRLSRRTNAAQSNYEATSPVVEVGRTLSIGTGSLNLPASETDRHQIGILFVPPLFRFQGSVFGLVEGIQASCRPMTLEPPLLRRNMLLPRPLRPRPKLSAVILPGPHRDAAAAATIQGVARHRLPLTLAFPELQQQGTNRWSSLPWRWEPSQTIGRLRSSEF
ncbi:hypothetical protein FAUST_3255 [Fusarium austroamericanum]|uniref:Uncharacterized protein n=1 Tax=Fusarium austroamericanum TaxID=282268 RepID=A0AAN6C5C9_FUSAU|nr:hypothetical protein FAUST_3255 [Fusarium austroamericanum]